MSVASVLSDRYGRRFRQIVRAPGAAYNFLLWVPIAVLPLTASASEKLTLCKPFVSSLTHVAGRDCRSLVSATA